MREIADIDEVMPQERKISMHEQTSILKSEDYPQGIEDNKRFETRWKQPCNFIWIFEEANENELDVLGKRKIEHSIWWAMEMVDDDIKVEIQWG